MKGVFLDSKNSPYATIQISLSSWKTFDCIIDTGFSGGIALPKKYQKEFHAEPLATQEFIIADGNSVFFKVYKTRAKFRQITKDITIFFTDNENALLGIEFLKGFKFVLDLKKMQVDLC